MKEILDKFSRQAKTYQKYRPRYPQALYDEVLSLTPKRQSCWDCGTGNGQVAIELAKHFEQVYATDISQQQLNQAASKPNITYKVERAESTSFPPQTFDLITVGQAMHWFDFEAFSKEIRRVGKKGAIISIWGYGLLRINQEIDAIIDRFYRDVVGPYWNKERKHVDTAYQSIPFDFEEIQTTQQLSIAVQWDRAQLEGYFNSWSSVQNYLAQNEGKNPVPELIKQLDQYWKAEAVKAIKFPIFMRNGII